MIRLTIPTIEDDDILAVSDVLRTGYLVQGERVRYLKKKSRYIGTKCNRSQQLHSRSLCMLALNIGPGDIVV
jgi:dTDP-4-amino-4,6-dideoxygalactose transaminase